jgi:secreted PhoX family phosphatase
MTGAQGVPDLEVVPAGGVFAMEKFRTSSLLAAAMMLIAAGAAYGLPNDAALWVVSQNIDKVGEFTGHALKTSGVNAPSRVLSSGSLDAPWGLLFDSHKNLWVSNVGDGALTMFTFKALKDLKNNSSQAAAVVITGLDRPEGMAFDKQGTLWVANEDNGELLGFTSDQITSSGAPTPAKIITSADLSSPVGIEFDRSGNLWVADDTFSTVSMFTKTQLAAAGNQSATVVLTDDGSGSLDESEPLVFDKAGNLWVGNVSDPVHNFGSVVEFSPGQLGSSGSPTPKVTLSRVMVTGSAAFTMDVPTGITFDASGNLWVADQRSDQHGSVSKFSKGSIKSNGSPQPKVFINSDNSETNLDAPFFLVFGPKVP